MSQNVLALGSVARVTSALPWPHCLPLAVARAVVISAGSGGENEAWRGERTTKQEAAQSSVTAKGKLPGAARSVGASKTKEASNKGQAEERSVVVAAGRPRLSHLRLAPRPPSCPAAAAAGGSRGSRAHAQPWQWLWELCFSWPHTSQPAGRGSCFHSQHQRLCGAARCRRGQSHAGLQVLSCLGRPSGGSQLLFPGEVRIPFMMWVLCRLREQAVGVQAAVLARCVRVVSLSPSGPWLCHRRTDTQVGIVPLGAWPVNH